MVHEYNINGLDYFTEKPRNNTYTKEFKQSVIDEYLEGTDSLLNLSIKYRIRSKFTLLSWVNKYNRHQTIEDYDPKGDVYMSKCRKVRYDEKLKIAEHCIENNYDYKKTASIYRLTYSQVYNWVKKYDEFDKEGLIDKRGKRTPIEDLSEIDKLKREKQIFETTVRTQRNGVDTSKKVGRNRKERIFSRFKQEAKYIAIYECYQEYQWPCANS